MNLQESVDIQCPYCWETIEVLVDRSIIEQSYVEDCQVCCRPILLSISIIADGSPRIEVTRENG